MYQIVNKEFTAYNGEKRPFFYREDTNDYNTILSIVRDDEYKTSQMTYSPGDVFIDIGAHIGAWSGLMESLVPQAKVIAVEPLPENAEIIKMNTHSTIIQKAVSNRDNVRTKIYYPDDSENGLHHKFVGNNTGSTLSEKYIEAETISLKTLLDGIPHVRVLKIDCEGGEHPFFRFADKETLSKIDYIIGEYHNNDGSEFKTRSSLFSSMKGLFDDIGIDKTEKTNGLIWFKRKGI